MKPADDNSFTTGDLQLSGPKANALRAGYNQAMARLRGVSRKQLTGSVWKEPESSPRKERMPLRAERRQKYWFEIPAGVRPKQLLIRMSVNGAKDALVMIDRESRMAVDIAGSTFSTSLESMYRYIESDESSFGVVEFPADSPEPTSFSVSIVAWDDPEIAFPEVLACECECLETDHAAHEKQIVLGRQVR